MAKNDEAWERYLAASGLALDGSVHRVTADDLKRLTGREPRLLAKFDEPPQLPRCLRRAGYGLLPVRNGEYLLYPGELFCPVPRCASTESVRAELPFNLDTAARGEGEAQYIDYAFNTGLLARFTGATPLYLTIRGRERTGCFRFRIADQEVEVDSVQIEVDAGYEGPRDIVLVEAKMGLPDHVNLRQLYYPWRHFRGLVPNKTVRPLLLTYDVGTTRYELHEFSFASTDDPTSVFILRSQGYRLFDPEQRRLDDLLDPARVPNLDDPYRLVPQADDFNRLVRLLEVLGEGEDQTDTIADRLGFDPRQAQYYREAAEYLGLVQPRSYWLSPAGRDLLRAGPRRRRELLARAVVNSWIVAALVRRGGAIDADAIAAVLATVAGGDGSPRYNPTTIRRRVKTIEAWLRWLTEETGCFRRQGGSFVAA